MPDAIQLRAIFDGLGDGLFIADAHGRYVDVNPAGCRMLGYTSDELLQLSVIDAVDPSERKRLAEVFLQMEDLDIHRSEWLFRRKDGSTFVGELVGGKRRDGMYQSVVRDVTERLERERLEQMLRREAAHRTKNVLSVVKALVRLSTASDVGQFKAALGKRIHALAGAHDPFVRSEWAEIDLEKLVRSQLKPFEEEHSQIEVSGPTVMVGPAAAQAIGMALHELGTNATKYGALSVEGGRVEVVWSLGESDEGPQFEICWREHGGPAVAEPSHRGFGTAMMVRMAEVALGGVVNLSFGEKGLCWTLNCSQGRLGSA